MKKILLPVFVTAIAVILLACSVSDPDPPPDLEWRNGWIRALPPGSGMTAAYGDLRNNSNQAIALDAFDSNAFAIVELHRSSMEDGVSRMREQKGVQIAAGETLQLQPGGLHLMLMKPKYKLKVGDPVEIGISSAGRRFVFSLPVESR